MLKTNLGGIMAKGRNSQKREIKKPKKKDSGKSSSTGSKKN